MSIIVFHVYVLDSFFYLGPLRISVFVTVRVLLLVILISFMAER